MQHHSTRGVLLSLIVLFTCAAIAQPAGAVVYQKKAAGQAPATWRTTVATTHLEVVYKDKGRLSVSVDGAGTVLPRGTVEVEKPPRSVVRKAFLVAASSGFSEYRLRSGEVRIAGAAVEWDLSVPNAIGSWNLFSDVTNLVKEGIDEAPAGRLALEITEMASDRVDGVVLAVVFENPDAGEDSEIALYFGAQNVGGDRFTIELSEPVGVGIGKRYRMGIGISHSLQASNEKGQFSTIDVNGRRLTTAAGGPDDGSPLRGALVTVGGLEDVPSNPADAFGQVVNLLTDDEYYDLAPFLKPGDARITVATASPSGDENIFFASFVASSSSPQSAASIPSPAVETGAEEESSMDAAGIIVNDGLDLAGGAMEDLGDASDGAIEDLVDVAGDPMRELVDVTDDTAGGHRPDNVTLTAAASAGRIGSASEITATVWSAGEPVSEIDVQLKIVSGPHAGVESRTRTDAFGRAHFLYRGLATGKDLLVAVVADNAGAVAGSNVLYYEWLESASRAFIDISPGVCPSVVNPDMQELLTVALTGTDAFEVESVDVTSLLLEDVAPVQVQYRDSSRPVESGDCPCSGDGADGIQDLVLRFRIRDLLGPGQDEAENSRSVTLSGRLESGELFEATNCVTLSRTLDRSIELPDGVLVPAPTETIEGDRR